SSGSLRGASRRGSSTRASLAVRRGGGAVRPRDPRLSGRPLRPAPAAGLGGGRDAGHGAPAARRGRGRPTGGAGGLLESFREAGPRPVSGGGAPGGRADDLALPPSPGAFHLPATRAVGVQSEVRSGHARFDPGGESRQDAPDVPCQGGPES